MTQFEVEDVLSQLTKEEKISLLAAVDFWHTARVERLGIPSVRVSDGPNGIRGTKFFDAVPSGCFPNGTGLASTFDAELLKHAGQLMADEAIAKNASVILGPTTNMQRGPLGGRGFESFSEDPFLAGIATASVVDGMQSKGIAATVKHFACNDLEDQRFASDSRVSDRALREIYLEPFRIAVKHANPICFMTAYNKINGVHCSQNSKLLMDILRGEWGWDGMVMSDWFGTYTTAAAIKNGLDIEFPGPTKWRAQELVSHSLFSKEQITINDVDDRVKGVLKMLKFVLENQEKTGVKENGPETTDNNTPKTAALLRKIAADAIVLLKNEDDVLPLKKEESVVVIGPNAKAKCSSGGGSASMTSYYVVSPYEGLVNKLGGKELEYTVGAESYKTIAGLFENMVVDPANGKIEGNLGCTASFFSEDAEVRVKNAEPFDKYVVTKSFVTLFDYKNEKVNAKLPLFYVSFEGYYIPEEDGEYDLALQVFGTGMMYLDDELIIDQKHDQVKGSFCFSAGTIEKTKRVALKKGHSYKIRIEYGSGPTSSIKADFGAGGLQAGIVKVIDERQEIIKAAGLAKKHDKVVLCIGLNGEWESEGYDRDDMSLPRKTNDLVCAVLEANPNTVIVNQSGTPVEMPWVNKAKALVQAWYGGNELGNAIADVLYGDVVPNGKLSLSWPLKVQDNPAYLNFKTESGRVIYGEDIFIGYRYYEKLQKQVAFPFGYGLSYTKFKFENLVINQNDDKIVVNLDITNVGDKFAGSEVIQIYVASTESSISRPVKELKGFKKVFLQPGEKSNVIIEMETKEAVSFFDEVEEKWCAEAGKYKVLVGSSSDDIELIGTFNVEKTFFWKGL